MKNCTPEYIFQLNPNEVFVFGSNLAGRHGKGAAKQAMSWGAQYGNPEGLQGQTYAIPTKDKSIRKTLEIQEIATCVSRFITFAKTRKDLHFLVTEIGCGLAGLSHEQIAPLFEESLNLSNISLPRRFLAILTNR